MLAKEKPVHFASSEFHGNVPWNISKSLQHLTGGMAHTNAVSAIDAHRDNNMIATGSLDSTAKLINTQTGKVVEALFPIQLVLTTCLFQRY